MSGQGSTDGGDIRQDSNQTFSVAVPASSGATTFTQYLRMGVANAGDEGNLPQDPTAATPLISAAGATSPFGSGELLYSTGATQLVAPYSYIRLGVGYQATKDSSGKTVVSDPLAYEGWLPSVSGREPPSYPGSPPPKFAPGNASGGFPTNGVVIYSNDTIQLCGASIQQTTSNFSSWSAGDSLSVVSKGNIAVSASYTLPGGPAASSTTFQFIDAMGLTAGNTSNFVTGNMLAYWLGNSASTGVGSLLWSNVGTTQNLFGGQIVNVTNDQMNIQGAGETKLVDQHFTVGTTSVVLGVSALAAGNLGLSATVITRLSIAMGVIGALVGAISLQDTIEVGIEADLEKNSNEMKKMMTASFSELSAAMGLIVVVQAMASIAGLVTRTGTMAAAISPLTTGIRISNAGVMIRAGASQLAVTPTGFSLLGLQQNNNVQLTDFF